MIKKLFLNFTLVLALSSCGLLDEQLEPEPEVEKLSASKSEIDYFNEGYKRDRAGDKQGAIEFYTKAIELNPQDDKIYYNRAIVRSSLGDKIGALEDYDRAIELNSQNSGAYHNRGLARSALGDKQGAIKDYDKAIVLDPNNAYAYYSRANIYKQLGNKLAARSDFEKAQDLLTEQGDEKWSQEAMKMIQELSK